MIVEEYCPNCNAYLKRQKGFNSNLKYWNCKKCGQQLINPTKKSNARYQDVVWYCDNCGAVLNEQKYFNDHRNSWTCKECGYKNSISDDEIYYDDTKTEIINDYEDKIFNFDSVIENVIDNVFHIDDSNNEEDYDNDEENDEYDDYEENDDENDGYDDYEDDNEDEENDDYSNEEYKNIENSFERKTDINYLKKVILADENLKSKLRWKRAKAFIFNKKLIMIGASSSELINDSIDKSVKWLLENGFTNIKIEESETAFCDENHEMGDIAEIIINGKTNFDDDMMIKYDDEIIIKYYTKKKFPFPYSSKQLHNKDAETIIEQLEKIGFTNIIRDEIDDLVVGWLKKDGMIENVLIDYKDNYVKNQEIEIDAEIKVRYHTFSKKKKYDTNK